LSTDSDSEKSYRSINLWLSYRRFKYVENSAFFHYNSGKKGAREMILTFLSFSRQGLPTHEKSEVNKLHEAVLQDNKTWHICMLIIQNRGMFCTFYSARVS
jgi:hypothetical protein